MEDMTSESETETWSEVTGSDDDHPQPPDTDVHPQQSDTIQQIFNMINAGASAFEILQNVNEIVDRDLEGTEIVARELLIQAVERDQTIETLTRTIERQEQELQEQALADFPYEVMEALMATPRS